MIQRRALAAKTVRWTAGDDFVTGVAFIGLELHGWRNTAADRDRFGGQRTVRLLGRPENDELGTRLEIILVAGNGGGNDGLRRHRDLFLFGLVALLVSHSQHLIVDGSNRGFHLP